MINRSGLCCHCAWNLMAVCWSENDHFGCCFATSIGFLTFYYPADSLGAILVVSNQKFWVVRCSHLRCRVHGDEGRCAEPMSFSGKSRGGVANGCSKDRYTKRHSAVLLKTAVRIKGFSTCLSSDFQWLSGRLISFLCLVGFLALAGCGGGGGSGSPPATSSTSSSTSSNTPSTSSSTSSNTPSTSSSTSSNTPSTPQCPRNQIPTHESLGLGCLEQAQFDARVNALAISYRQSMDERKQWQLRALRAEYAYAHLHLLQGADATPGKGITIGFVDSGIDPSSPLVAGVGITERFFGGATRESARKTTHGTRVVSVAVRRPGEFYGLAYGADVAMLAIPLGDGSSRDFYDPVQFNSGDDYEDSRLFIQALKMDTPILNLSIAYQGIIEDYTEEYLRKNYSKTITVLAQKGVKDKTVFVLSASNDNGDPCRVADIGSTRCVGADSQGVGAVDASSPSVWAGLPARIPELRGHWVAVVAIGDVSGGDWRFPSIAGYSNRCGIARDWCIAAPGSIAFPAGGGNSPGVLRISSGTSFAAPLVSGGLAIMKQLFRDQLSNTELLARLFKTADKSGRYADRDIYGQGLMDLRAATNPWGEAAFMRTGQFIHSRADPVGVVGTGLRASTAIGDSFVQALSGQEVAAFDDLGAPFWYAADNFVQSPQTDLLAARMDRLFAKTASTRLEVGDWHLGLRSGGGVQDFGHLALTDHADRINLSLSEDWSVAYFKRSQRSPGSSLSGLATAWHPPGLSAVALQAGWLSERNTLLGSSASGAFGRLAGRTNFVSVELEAAGPSGWHLSTRGEWGVVRPANADGLLLRDLSTLYTDAYRVVAHRRLANGGSLQVAMEQPVRVARGTADLELPTGRSAAGRVLGRSMRVGMTPTGRQRDLSARLDYSVANGSLTLEGVVSQEPGHRATASAEWTVLMGWTTRF